MLPCTGDYIEYIEYIDNNIDDFKYYMSTPRPLMHGGMYKIDDKLSALLIEAHRNTGFLEGFEMIHPFEQYNGIVGRIMVLMVLMVLRNTIDEALSLISLFEHLYYNKNEHFNLLRATQYSGSYIWWIMFFVNAISETAKWPAQLLIQYENIVVKDIKQLEDIQSPPKSIWLVCDHLKLFPVTNISHTAKQLGSSFNPIPNALRLLREHSIVTQETGNVRNRVWKYASLAYLLAQG